MAVKERSKIYEILLFSFQYFVVCLLLLFLLARQQMQYYFIYSKKSRIFNFFSAMALAEYC